MNSDEVLVRVLAVVVVVVAGVEVRVLEVRSAAAVVVTGVVWLLLWGAENDDDRAMEMYCSNSSNRCCCCRRKWPLEVAFSGCFWSSVCGAEDGSCRCCFCTGFEHFRTHGQHDTGDDRGTMSMLGSRTLPDSGCLTVSGLYFFSLRQEDRSEFSPFYSTVATATPRYAVLLAL